MVGAQELPAFRVVIQVEPTRGDVQQRPHRGGPGARLPTFVKRLAAHDTLRQLREHRAQRGAVFEAVRGGSAIHRNMRDPHSVAPRNREPDKACSPLVR